MNPAGLNELRLALILMGPAVKSAFVAPNKAPLRRALMTKGHPDIERLQFALHLY